MSVIVAREVLPGLDGRWVLVDESALPALAAQGDGEHQELLLRVAAGFEPEDVARLAAAAVGDDRRSRSSMSTASWQRCGRLRWWPGSSRPCWSRPWWLSR